MSGEAYIIGHPPDGHLGDKARSRLALWGLRLMTILGPLAGAVFVLALTSGPARADEVLPSNEGIESVPAAASSAARSSRAEAAVEKSVGSGASVEGSAAVAQASVDDAASASASAAVNDGAAAAVTVREEAVSDVAIDPRATASGDGGTLEVAVESPRTRARARLDAAPSRVAASLETGRVRLSVSISLSPPARYPTPADPPAAQPADEASTITWFAGATMANRGQLARRPPSRAEPAFPLPPSSKFTLRERPDTGRGPSRAPPAALPDALLGSRASSSHDVQDHAVAGAVCALLALALAGRLSPGRSDPREGVAQRILAPG